MIPLRSDKLQAGQGTLSLTNHGYVSPATMDALLARAAEMPAGTVFPEDKQANFVQTHGLPCLVRDTEKFTDFVVNVEPLASMMSPSGKATTCPVDDQIFLNKFTLESFAVRLNKALEVEPYRRPTEDFYLASVTFAASAYSARDKGSLSTDYTELCEKIKAKFVEQVVQVGQKMIAKCTEGKAVLLEVTSIDLATLAGGDGADESKAEVAFGPMPRGLLNKKTTIVLEAKRGDMKLIGDDRAVRRDALNLDFGSMGIGGLNKEFEVIFRRAFASRIYPADVLKGLGIQHVKGILLYGPPGCGKTLIARKIGEMLKARPPKIVNGPELLNKYVGASEENVRALFAEAEAEYEEAGDESELHIIIMDEIDAICKARGSTSGGTGVSDNIVNQLLSKLDGAKQINNILVIGMTNRLDMIDSAITRPGRLEVKIEIGLPSEEGRLQILQIHTKDMDHNGYLSSDVSLPTLATELKNYTGAEIAGICRTAAAYTLKSQIDLDNIQEFKVDRSKLKVKMEHFRFAARESKPAFGVKDDELKIFYRNGIIDYGPEFQALKARLDAVVNQVRDSDRTPLMSVLLSGPPGAGRTALAAACAQSSGYPFAKMITADMFIGHSERSKIDKIFKVFEDAAKTPLGIIVLDDLERILSYVDLGPQFSNPMLQALMVLLNKPPKEVGRRVLVIGTTSCASKLARLGITSRFNVEIDVPPISRPEEFQKIMQEWADMSPNVAAELSQQLPEPIPIKRLLMVLEMARQADDAGGAVTSDAFHKCLFDCGYRSLDGLGLNK